MTSPTKTGKTPANVADLATQSDKLNRNKLTLLGVFGPANAMTALVRLPNGRVRRIETGDKLAASIVVTINADGLMLAQRGQTRRLSFPGSLQDE